MAFGSSCRTKFLGSSCARAICDVVTSNIAASGRTANRCMREPVPETIDVEAWRRAISNRIQGGTLSSCDQDGGTRCGPRSQEVWARKAALCKRHDGCGMVGDRGLLPLLNKRGQPRTTPL